MHVELIDTTFRDGSQSLWAMGLTTGMMEAVAADMDQAGFAVMDMPATGPVFKKLLREYKENPWDTMRMLARLLPNTPKTAMAGAFISPFEKPPPLALIRLFYARLVEIGVLNRVQVTGNTTDQLSRTFPTLLPLFRELGLQIFVCLSYSVSPRHTDEYYARKTREAVQHKPDGIILKDQGGLLTPDRTRTLVPVMLENAGGLPLEIHSHCTTALAPLCYLEALALGVGRFHTAVPPLANGPAQPSVFNIAGNARLMGHTTAIDEERLRSVAARLTLIARREDLPIGTPLEYDKAQFIHQVPGGVISNLQHQLKLLRMEDRLDDVIQESVQVRKDLGYPIMITPHSQFVVSQAAVNVALGERYKEVLDEIIQFALGVYGDEDAGVPWMDPNVKDRILSHPRAKDLAGRAPAQPTLDEVRQKLGGPGVSDEELLLRYIMKGDAEIQAMRAAGPPRRYPSGPTPLLALLEEASNNPNVRYLQVEKGNDRLVVDKV